MKRYLGIMIVAVGTMLSTLSAGAAKAPAIEVTGSATIHVVPDRITVEIGLTEYYRPVGQADSTLVTMSEIEERVRQGLCRAGVSDDAVTVADMGNFFDTGRPRRFLMSRILSVELDSFSRLDAIASGLGSDGISSFRITSLDSRDMERHDRQGLKAALDAAREKAEFIAANERLTLLRPIEIVENAATTGGFGLASNVSFDAGGSGMDSMRRIVRRYSVRVKYTFSAESPERNAGN